MPPLSSAEPWPFLTPSGAQECRLLVVVVPNARRSEVAGIRDDALRVRVAAPALEGRANEALIAWLALQLGVARRCVELEHGETSRRKRVRLSVSATRVAMWLDEQLGRQR
jgi:uncharacterized protein (TIGR00251 family)